MARRATGTVVEHTGKDGCTFRALRFTAYGKRRYLSLGAVGQQDAERQLGHVLADVDRGTWQPAQQAAPVPPEAMTFHAFAEQWWVERERELSSRPWPAGSSPRPTFATACWPRPSRGPSNG